MIGLAENELSDNPFEEGLRQRMLQSALAYYQEFIRAKESDPAAQADLAQTRDRVERILADLAVLQADRYSMLLGEPAVLGDLGVTAAQMAGVAEVVRLHEEDRRGWFRDRETSGPRQHYERAVESARRNDALLSEVLSVAQRQRLRQIALRRQGVRAFQDFAVIDGLGLSVDQRSELKRIIEKASFRRPGRGGPGAMGGPGPIGSPGLMGGPGPMSNPGLMGGPGSMGAVGVPGGPGRRERPGGPEGAGGPPLGGPGPHLDPSHERVVMAEILAIFTADQLLKWRAMIGRDFAG
jgi:hypothetical protein